MQAAENLYEKMWGQNLDQKLKVHSEVIGVRWKYLSKDYLDLLQLPTLGYMEGWKTCFFFGTSIVLLWRHLIPKKQGREDPAEWLSLDSPE